jgi:hypothetical protein
MFLRICFAFALACSALWLVGCGGGQSEEKPPAKDVAAYAEKKDEKPAAKKVIPAGPQTVTLHVPEMKMRGGNEGAELT